ncbi:MAG: OmpH family outer membrane protein [Hymenobacteraceae bacterium]|nr:OmpH family outer membrane protein [Hymenobacteraceae bacterium]MDX5396545.1 OmpH family outer membrane protein [Hymenobacteraceae bacterium]MDX5443313.1 OmpH family outer membrane protein [Hymenobacteraceae bacterium]MDX5512609.1 OmpH family outer membrane protein [Hymenobacteraceae bacterium]
MKKVFFLFLLSIFASNAAFAQKFGYVDSEYILSRMPGYANAQKEIDKLSATWQKEIEDMYKDIDKMYKAYQAEEVLLTDEMKKKRQDAIIKKEQEVKEYQKKIFGFEGTLFKRRQELIRPVQDEIFTAIEKVAKSKQLQIIFDKSGDLVMLYTNPVHDYTEFVLEELGLKSEEQNLPGQKPKDTNIDRPVDRPDSPDDLPSGSRPPGRETKRGK